MNENDIFEVRASNPEAPGKKPTHVPSLVIGVLSLALCLVIALAGEVLGVIGIVMASKKRSEYNTKAALVCSIIGLVLGVANHILGVLMVLALL